MGYMPRDIVRAVSGRPGCKACRDGRNMPFDFTMAFQPIVAVDQGRVWGYEALVRGMDGEGAAAILDRVAGDLTYSFDQACRVKAVELAGRLFAPGTDVKLSINFMPNAVYQPDACIRATLEAATRARFNAQNLMFEFTENERITDVPHIRNIIQAYQKRGFTTAIDDFGAGYAGLGLLAELMPDLVKIDMALVRDIDTSLAKRAIVAAIVVMCKAMGIRVLAEGIETAAELETLRELGISLCQGYYFARPEIEALPDVHFDGDRAADTARPIWPQHVVGCAAAV